MKNLLMYNYQQILNMNKYICSQNRHEIGLMSKKEQIFDISNSINRTVVELPGNPPPPHPYRGNQQHRGRANGHQDGGYYRR